MIEWDKKINFIIIITLRSFLYHYVAINKVTVVGITNPRRLPYLIRAHEDGQNGYVYDLIPVRSANLSYKSRIGELVSNWISGRLIDGSSESVITADPYTSINISSFIFSRAHR